MNTQQYFPLVGASGTAQSDAAGYDGRWFVADENNQWLTAAACPALAGINVELRLGYLVLRAPGMLRLDVPLEVIEDDDSVRFTVLVGATTVDVIDEGELAAAWFSNVAGQPCGLMKVHPDSAPPNWLAAD